MKYFSNTNVIIRNKIHVFLYNFKWTDYYQLLNGWINKCSLLVPIIGYAIILNDSVSGLIEFKIITDARKFQYGLNSGERLRFIYFGFLFLGFANVIYLIRRPYILKLGETLSQYYDYAFKRFTIEDFIELDDKIISGQIMTRYGKYHTAEFESFLFGASFPEPIDPKKNKYNDPLRKAKIEGFGFNNAKQRYENLLKCILFETFFRENRSRPFSLTFCISLSLIGYSLLIIPSIDLFVKVFIVAFDSI